MADKGRYIAACKKNNAGSGEKRTMKKPAAAQIGNRNLQPLPVDLGPAGPRGKVNAYDKILRDKSLHGTGAQTLEDGEAHFASEERTKDQFRCNMKKPGELPFGSAVEVGGISCEMSHRNRFVLENDLRTGGNDGLADAEELADLIANYGYIELVKDKDTVLLRMPMSHIHQFNALMGDGAGDDAKYALQRGITLLKEPITIVSGEQWEVKYRWSKDPSGGIDPEDRYNGPTDVDRHFAINLHCKVVEKPILGR